MSFSINTSTNWPPQCSHKSNAQQSFCYRKLIAGGLSSSTTLLFRFFFPLLVSFQPYRLDRWLRDTPGSMLLTHSTNMWASFCHLGTDCQLLDIDITFCTHRRLVFFGLAVDLLEACYFTYPVSEKKC